jgi:hypothetical protein
MNVSQPQKSPSIEQIQNNGFRALTEAQSVLALFGDELQKAHKHIANLQAEIATLKKPATPAAATE